MLRCGRGARLSLGHRRLASSTQSHTDDAPIVHRWTSGPSNSRKRKPRHLRAASGGGFEASPLNPRRPQGADVLRQRLANLLHLVRIETVIEYLKRRLRVDTDVDY